MKMFQFFWTRPASLWIAVLYIALGVLLLVFPGAGGSVFVWSLALGAVVYGISHLWRFLHSRKSGSAPGGDLFLSIVSLAFAAFALVRPMTILAFLPLTLGILLLADGLGKMPLVYTAMKESSPAKLPLFFASLIPFILGMILIFNPFQTVRIVIMVFGVTLIMDGISDLFTVAAVRKYLSDTV